MREHQDHPHDDTRADEDTRPEQQQRQRGMSLSMHDGVDASCDCCSCEAEPYWVEAAEAMGIDLGSDYEDPAR